MAGLGAHFGWREVDVEVGSEVSWRCDSRDYSSPDAEPMPDLDQRCQGAPGRNTHK